MKVNCFKLIVEGMMSQLANNQTIISFQTITNPQKIKQKSLISLLFYIFQTQSYNMSHKHSLHQLNPNWEHAEKHGEASKTGMINYEATIEGDEQVVCSCCNEHVSKEPVSIMVHSKQLQFLGLGFPLFYEFLKLCMLMLVISIGCYHALALFTDKNINLGLCNSPISNPSSHRLLGSTALNQTYINSTDSHSTDPYHTAETENHGSQENANHQQIIRCYTFFVQIASISPKEQKEETAIRVIEFIVQLLTLLFIRNQLIKMQAYYDERSTTLADYSMIITGINRETKVRENILTFLQKQMGANPPQVAEVLLIPQITELQKLKGERTHIIEQLKTHYKGNQQEQQHQKTIQLSKSLAKINQNILTISRRTYKAIKNDEMNCDKAIVIFNSEQDRINAQQGFEKKDPDSLAQYFGIQHTVKFEEAPEPEQIIWENSSIPIKEKRIRIIIGWILSLLLLAIVFTVFYFILIEKSLLLEKASEELIEQPQNTSHQRHYQGAIFLVYFLMFSVVLFDKIVLSYLFHKFTQLQKHNTTADLQFSFALKYAIGLFFTTALMTLAVEAIKFHNYYSHLYGVIDEESIMFLMNSFFIPFFWLVNPSRIWKNIKRKLYHGKKNITQQEANKLMEEENYDLGKRFAEVIQMMWFVYLYSTLIPIGAVIIVVGLFFYYWVDKYNLLRRSKVHGKVSGHFIQTSLTLLDLTLLIRPIGSLIFDSQIREGAYLKQNIVMILIAIIYLAFPKNYFIELINQQFFKPQQKLYNQVKHRFHHNYQSEHPLYNLLSKQQLQGNAKDVREYEDPQLINIPNCFDIEANPFDKEDYCEEQSKQSQKLTRKSEKSIKLILNKQEQNSSAEILQLKSNFSHVKLKPIEHINHNSPSVGASKETSQHFQFKHQI